MPAAPAAASAVVFVHGIWMTGLEMCLLRRRVAADGHRTHRFRYASLWRSFDENVRRLHAFVRAHPAPRLHLVGHSLGGLLILELLRRYDDIPPGRVVLLGSPVRGSRVARALAGRRLGLLLGRAGPGVLAAAHSGEWDGRRPVGVIAGTLGFGIGRLFGELPEPHDGTVAVEETRLAGAAGRLELPVTHMGLLVSRRVAGAVRGFLAHGRFDA